MKHGWAHCKGRFLAAASVGLLLAMTLSGCGSDAGDATSGGTTKVTALTSSDNVTSSIMYIAKYGGFFEENGLNVELVNSGNTGTGITALLGGSGQFLMGGISNFVPAIEKGESFKVIARGTAGLSNSLVLSKKTVDRLGVSPTDPVTDRTTALDGLTLTGPSESSNFVFETNKAAETAGATVKWVYGESESMVSQVAAGQIDGIVAAPPYTTELVRAGTGAMWLDGPNGQFPGGFTDKRFGPAVLAVSADYAQNNTDILVAMMKSLVQASELVKTDPEKAKSLLRENQFNETNEETFEAIWADVPILLSDPLMPLDSIAYTMEELDLADRVNPDELFPAEACERYENS